MRERALRFFAALAAFLRGFSGLEPIATDAAGARRDLSRRAAHRRACC